MSTKRFKQILPAAKYALSSEQDTYSSVPFDGKMREIPEVETGDNILVEEVFEDERNESSKYRISAQMDMLALVNDPYINYLGVDSGVPTRELTNPTTRWCANATNGDQNRNALQDPGDPIYGEDANYGPNYIYPHPISTTDKQHDNNTNNWFVKVLYPESYLPNDTQISFSSFFPSNSTIYIQDGLPIVGVYFTEIDQIMYPCFITETDVQLEVDDEVYINAKIINNPQPSGQFILGTGLTGFHRVLDANLNADSLGVEMNGYLPADSKLFIIDHPLLDVAKVNPASLGKSPGEQNILTNIKGNNFIFKGSYKRVVGVSKKDSVAIDGSMGIYGGVTSVDADGTPNTNGQYTQVTVINPHGLAKGFYVELPLDVDRFSQGVRALTGIFRVELVVSDKEFIIDATINVNTVTNKTSIRYRPVDAIASDYKIRMFKELTDLDDYVLDRTGFATNIFGDQSYLINVTKDINTEGLTDYLGRPLSELFLGFFKRAGSKSYDWSHVVSHYSHIMRGIQGNIISGLGDPGYSPIPGVLPVTSYYLANKTTAPLEDTYSGTLGYTLSYPSQRLTPDDIVVNDAYEVTSATYFYGTDTTSNGKYLGDLVEYNRGELTERVISDIFHRFNTTWRAFGYFNACRDFDGDYEGLFYKPFHRYPIRKWADAVEAATPPVAQPNDPFSAYTESIQFEGVPTYAEEVQGLKIWRDLLDPGIIDSEGVIDNPFLNGANYLYDNIKISLRRQTPGRSGFDIRVNNLDFYNSKNTYTPNELC